MLDSTRSLQTFDAAGSHWQSRAPRKSVFKFTGIVLASFLLLLAGWSVNESIPQQAIAQPVALPTSEMAVRAIFINPQSDRQFQAKIGDQPKSFQMAESSTILQAGKVISLKQIKAGSPVTLYLLTGSAQVVKHLEVESL